MAKMRVFELAKEFGIEAKELVPKLQELGFKVVNQMSGLSEGEVARAQIELKGLATKGKVVEKRVGSAVIRRRKKVEEEEEKVTEALPEEEILPVDVAPAVEEEVKEKKPTSRRNVKRIPKVDEIAEEEAKVVETKVVQTPVVPTSAKKEAPSIEKSQKSARGFFEEEEAEKAKRARRALKEAQAFRPTDYLKVEKVFTPVKKKVVKGTSREMLKPILTEKKASKRVVKMTSDQISVADLAKQLGVKGSDIIKKLMDMGTMATLNQQIDQDSATLIASEHKYEVEKVGPTVESLIPEIETKPQDLKSRPPVVTVMGHVDHGKTSLLDAIRKTNVIAGEAGGITQHIGAYTVALSNKKMITFLDTPGHEAFTAMRARGAQVTDIVVLVVAADDGIMPQTVEAIHHAKAAGVPVIVAINKIDKPDANPDRVKKQLTEHELVSEDWGGTTITALIAAKKGEGVSELLEMILLQAEMLELKANPNGPAQGVIIESKLDRGRGAVATVLIKQGTLKTGDAVVSGLSLGRARGLFDDSGKKLNQAGPSTAVEIIGLDSVPVVGGTLNAVKDEKRAREIVEIRKRVLASQEIKKTAKVSLEELYQQVSEGEVAELKLVIKGDVAGSVEALREALSKIKSDKVKIVDIHSGVGAVTESDVNLASASNAMIIAFHVRPEAKAVTLAESVGVEIKTYRIIYEAVDDIRNAMEGLLSPEIKEVVVGKAEVRNIFSTPKVGTIAGCAVTQGKIVRSGKVRLLRDNVVVWEGNIGSLRRFKDDVREVKENYECGLGLEGYGDVKPGDIIECYILEESKATLKSEEPKKSSHRSEVRESKR